MKKKLVFICLWIFTHFYLHAQSVGIGTATPNASAQLDISTTTKGVLLPRMASAAVLSITSPAKGLMVYDTSKNELFVNMGTPSTPNWKSIATNSSWNVNGNTGTNPVTQFIGTVDNKPLLFRMNNKPAGKIDSLTRNTYLGYRSGNATTGSSNTSMGYLSFSTNTTGVANTAIGDISMLSNTTGNYNTAQGYGALFSNINGEANTAVGVEAMRNNLSGDFNTGLGTHALYSNSIGNYNTAVGHDAMLLTNGGQYNTGVGVDALYSNVSGDENTAVGFDALVFNNNGDKNTAIGNRALFSNSFGHDNDASGYESLLGNTEGNGNTAHGTASLRSNSTGHNNTALGNQALYNNNTGNGNVGLGTGALLGNTVGTGNVAIGWVSLLSTADASFNVAIGHWAAHHQPLGWNNILIGPFCDANSPGYFNSIGLGASTVITASNQVRIGNSSTTSIGGFTNWSNISDGRYKKNVREDVRGLDFIMKLRPVTYQLDITNLSSKLHESSDIQNAPGMIKAMEEKESMIQSGFIAQEVEQAAASLGYNFSGVDQPKNDDDLYGLRYAEFVVPLVKAVQELQQQVQDLQQQVEELKNRNK